MDVKMKMKRLTGKDNKKQESVLRVIFLLCTVDVAYLT